MQRGRVGLQTDESAGEHLVVGVPPPLLAGVPGQLDQRLALLVADRVELEHVPHIAGSHAHVTGLDATDLGRRALKLLAHLIDGQFGSLTQPAQFASEPSATHRRALTSPHPHHPSLDSSTHMLITDALHCLPRVADWAAWRHTS
jgi:hypothetical protein